MINHYIKKKKHFIISTEAEWLDKKRIHHFLSTQAYWCQGIPASAVSKAIDHSLCFGVYDGKKAPALQIGFGRVVTDYSTFAWICDLYIEKEYREQGLGKWLVTEILAHPELKGLRRICLATKDAHGLYEKHGFRVTETPQNWLEIKDNDIYKKMLEA